MDPVRGAGFPRIESIRLDVDSSDYEYRLIDERDGVVERGTFQLSAGGGPPTSAVFQPDDGLRRPVLFDIVGDTMRIDLAAPGGPAPVSRAASPVYRTTR